MNSGDLIACYTSEHGVNIAYGSDPTVYGCHKAEHVRERWGIYLESSADDSWCRILFPFLSRTLWLSRERLLKYAR